MASELAPDALSLESERRLLRQIQRTGRRMKWMELAVGLCVWLALVLAFLLTLAVVDHWIWPLGGAARWLALAVLLGGSGYYLLRLIAPLLMHRINPVYAAQRIERNAAASSKNSLINWLTLKDVLTRASVRRTLQDQADVDLQHADVDAALDWKKLWWACYAVIGAAAALAIYSAASPKDAMASAARVLAPWSNIAEPTRVRITDVTPGDSSIIRGRHAEVRAKLRGLAPDETVRLLLSSEDGLLREHEVLMEQDPQQAGGYVAQAPVAPEGAQADILYRIAAGDAETREFRLTLDPAPVIVVERLEYRYPPYTQRGQRVVEKQGDISGLEGATVRIQARASHPIRLAYLEFNVEEVDEQAGVRAEQQPLSVDGQIATGEIQLKLQPDRRTPVQHSYRVRFVTDEGLRSENAAIHGIEVIRDFEPVIEILSPQASLVEMPVNGRLRVEARAVDPDYGLTEIAFRALSGSQNLVHEQRPQEELLGQHVEQFQFDPGALGLQAGDEITLWATASDNRHNPAGELEPNVARSEVIKVRLLPPKEQPQDANGERQTEPGESSPNPEQNTGNQEQKQDGQQGEGGESSRSEGADSEQGGQAGDQDRTGQQQGRPEDARPEEGSPKDGQGGAGAGNEDSEKQPSSEATGQGGSKSPDDQSDPSREGDASSQGSNDAGAGDTSNSARPNGQGGQNKPGEPSTAQEGDPKGRSPGDGSGNGGARPDGSQQDAEPLHDGEVIERVQDYLREKDAQQEKGQQPKDQADGRTTGEPQGGESKSGEPGEPQSGEPQSGEPQSGEPKSGEPKSGEPKSGDPKSGDPKSGEPQSGEPQSGEPQSGEPQSGEPQSGEPKSGDPKSGEPKSGEPKSGESRGDKPKSGESPDDSATGQGQQGERPAGGQAGEGESAAPQGDGAKKDAAREGTGETPAGGKPDSTGDTGQPPTGGESRPDSKEGSPAGQRAEDTAQDPSRAPQPGQTGDDRGQPGNQGDQRAPDQPPQGSSDRLGNQTIQQSGGGAAGDGEKQPGEAGGMQQPGADRGGEKQPPAPGAGDEPGADPVNVDYARKATNMVLEHLEEQQENPDPELLNKLNWTREDLEKFIQRWRSMQEQSRQKPEGSQQFEEALRSLGVRPPQDRIRRSGAQDDSVRGLRDDGDRSQPPPAFLEKFNAFKKGAAGNK